jgi:hypothetical protein
MKHLVLIIITSLIVLSPTTVFAKGGCTCYDDTAVAHSIDASNECKETCGNDAGASVTGDSVCECSDGTTPPLKCEKTCVANGLLASLTSSTTSDKNANKTAIITPQLSIDIPTVDFSDSVNKDGNILHVNFLGTYIAGAYKYLLGAGTIISIVMVMIGGLQYAFAGGYGSTEKAKTRIKNAVTGLVLLLSTYLILWTVNPELVRLRTISLENQAEDALIALSLESCEGVKGSVTPCSVQTLKQPGGSWTKELTDLVNTTGRIHGVDPLLLAAHLQIETGGSPNYSKTDRGPCGEIGVAQFMPSSFESTVSQECCVRTASKSEKTGERVGNVCDEGNIEGWPPDPTQFPDCATDVCWTCQVARDSCAEYFDTSSAEGLANTLAAQAKFIKKRVDSFGDYAQAMCAYNGSGSQAAHYAAKAGGFYKKFCQDAGGTQ